MLLQVVQLGFRFGAVGATPLTSYPGFGVRYTKTGSLVQVEGLIYNSSTAALVISNNTVLYGLPPLRAGSSALMAIGLQQWATPVAMQMTTAGALSFITAVTLSAVAGATMGGYVAINFSYHTT